MTPYHFTSSFEENENVAWRLQARIALLVRCQAMRCLALWILNGRHHNDNGEEAALEPLYFLLEALLFRCSTVTQIDSENGPRLSPTLTGQLAPNKVSGSYLHSYSSFMTTSQHCRHIRCTADSNVLPFKFPERTNSLREPSVAHLYLTRLWTNPHPNKDKPK